MKSASVIKIGSLKIENEAERGRIVIADVPEPVLGDEQVKIKVAYCSICGTDPHRIEQNLRNDTLPFGLGHEMSGVITEVGKNATKHGFKPGDRVAGIFQHFCGTCDPCRSGNPGFCEYAADTNQPCLSEYVTWHEAQVYKLPDNMSLKTGCMLEPVSVAVMAVDRIAPIIGQQVAICGGGPIGLLLLQTLKMMGAVDLTLIEPIENRRELAIKYGADHVINPFEQDVVATAMEITKNHGYDIVVDCSGVISAIGALLDIAAKGGMVMFLASYPRDVEIPMDLNLQFYRKRLTLTGTRVNPESFLRSLYILPRMQLDDFITTVYELDDIQAAFEAQVSGKYPKILVRCNHFEGE